MGVAAAVHQGGAAAALTIEDLEPIGLEELDRRAALQRRTDQKYLLPRELMLELLGELAHDHLALEIDGRRRFAYESVYFDTPDLRCFFDHVEDRHPRFKIRTRLYVDSRRCEFEVKLTRSAGETDKRSIGHDPDRRETLSDEGRRLAAELTGLAAPDELRPALRTEFTRVTLAAADEPERVTIDLGVTLSAVRHGRAELDAEHVLVESKTRDGDGRFDELMRARGIESTSLSKYRLGIGLLVRPAADARYSAARARHFGVRRPR